MKLLHAVFFPLVLAFVLLFAQQAGVTHVLHHAFEYLSQHEGKQMPHSDICEKCADYGQLGSALNTAAYEFPPFPVSAEAVQYRIITFRPIHILAATARAPPYSA